MPSLEFLKPNLQPSMSLTLQFPETWIPSMQLKGDEKQLFINPGRSMHRLFQVSFSKICWGIRAELDVLEILLVCVKLIFFLEQEESETKSSKLKGLPDGMKICSIKYG
mmetsp:Transcript_10219/g.15271  ORF Transcript_10219/g.15271 Transcript_10219/m.15271 type:complete len:109 (-) Transcript_10219:171-497(-)